MEFSEKEKLVKLLKQDEFIKQIDFSCLDFVKGNSRAASLMNIKAKLKDTVKPNLRLCISSDNGLYTEVVNTNANEDACWDYLEDLSELIPVSSIVDNLIMRDKVNCINSFRAFYKQFADDSDLLANATVDFSNEQLDVINKMLSLAYEAESVHSKLVGLINYGISTITLEGINSDGDTKRYMINAKKESRIDMAKSIVDMLINRLKLEFSEAILKIVDNIEKFFAS